MSWQTYFSVLIVELHKYQELTRAQERYRTIEYGPYASYLVRKIKVVFRFHIEIKGWWYRSVIQLCLILWPHGLQHTRPPCPSPSPGVCPSSCSLHCWCHPAILSSDALFSFCPWSFPASRTFRWVICSHQITKIMEFQQQHQSF